MAVERKCAALVQRDELVVARDSRGEGVVAPRVVEQKTLACHRTNQRRGRAGSSSARTPARRRASWASRASTKFSCSSGDPSEGAWGKFTILHLGRCNLILRSVNLWVTLGGPAEPRRSTAGVPQAALFSAIQRFLTIFVRCARGRQTTTMRARPPQAARFSAIFGDSYGAPPYKHFVVWGPAPARRHTAVVK